MPSGLNSCQSPRPGRVLFRGRTKAHCKKKKRRCPPPFPRQLSSNPQPASFVKPKHQKRCCCTSEPKPERSGAPPWAPQRSVCQWHKQVLAAHGGDMKQNRTSTSSSKLLSSCAIISCSPLFHPPHPYPLLFVFLLQINSREKTRDPPPFPPQSTMSGREGRRRKFQQLAVV